MYLWKYWRESRNTFAVGVALVGLMLWGVLEIPARAGFHPLVTTAAFYAAATAAFMLPLAFMGLRFGSFGAGRDLGEGSGAFLFSRPRKRAFFVWTDWGFGMAQMLILIAAAYAVAYVAVHRMTIYSGSPASQGSAVSMFSIFCLHCAAGALLAGLMFGLTYFCSVFAKNRGVLLALGVVVVYLIGKSVVKHYWPNIDLPNLMLTEFSIHNVTTRMVVNGGYMTETHPELGGFADHLGIEIALRAALALAFPLAAQFLLQKRDID